MNYLIAKGLLNCNHRVLKDEKVFKIVKSGVIMQPKTHLGIPYDIIISWLQKSIRTGNYMTAKFCAYNIISLDMHPLNKKVNTMFRSHLLNRLITIMSEDVGLAENIVEEIESRYWQLYHTDIGIDLLAKIISEMLWILCQSRKSRYTDWLYMMMVYNLKLEQEDPVYNKIVKILSEGNYIKHLNFRIYEVILLYNLYKHRGHKYGVLFLIHALVMSIDKKKKKRRDLLEGFSFNLEDDWYSNEYLKFSIPDSVIDRHTRWGSTYLGRDMYFFMAYSSHLENNRVINSEAQMRAKLIEYFAKVENIYPKVSYKNREYQKNIIEEIGVQLDAGKNQICCNMATGTGKTWTSYLIIKEYLIKNPNKVVLVVFPTLDILDQTAKTWRDIVEYESWQIMVGIFSSKHYKYPRHYFNYEYVKDLERFMGYSERLVGKKFIFSTYASLGKKKDLIDKYVDLAVYDEGHHLTAKTVISGQKIILTATPNNIYDYLAQYSIGDAIRNNDLTPFNVTILSENNEQQNLDKIIRMSRKTIVYSRLNSISRRLYDEFDTDTYMGEKYYIDSSLGNRREIIKNFKEANRAIIFNCSIMSEGVDIVDCDSIYIHSGRISYNPFVQSIGRALRKSPNKSSAMIYIVNDKHLKKRLANIAKLGYNPDILK